MLENIINTCNKFNVALEHSNSPIEDLPTEDDMALNYLELDLAKSIIEDIDSHNAKRVAKIILGYAGCD